MSWRSNRLHHDTKKYVLFNKPYGVLAQFTDSAGRRTLSDFGPFPSDIYPVGRLDADSEGLLLLTNDGQSKHLLLEPRFAHRRTYWVQIEGIPTDQALAKLRAGLVLGGKRTKQCVANQLDIEPAIPPRDVPIRYRKNVPTAWIELFSPKGATVRYGG